MSPSQADGCVLIVTEEQSFIGDVKSVKYKGNVCTFFKKMAGEWGKPGRNEGPTEKCHTV